MPLNSIRMSIIEVLIVLLAISVTAFAEFVGLPQLSLFMRGVILGAFLIFMTSVIDEHLLRFHQNVPVNPNGAEPTYDPESEGEAVQSTPQAQQAQPTQQAQSTQSTQPTQPTQQAQPNGSNGESAVHPDQQPSQRQHGPRERN